jgi:mannose-6-phosphate isomerase
MQSDCYPLIFDPVYVPKVWGGNTLEQMGRQLPGDQASADAMPIGESWELVDLPLGSITNPTISAKGQTVGQDEPRHTDVGPVSVITNGPLAGKTLHQVINEFGEQWNGRLRPTETGHFPLLVKYLDARQNLSLQVHPSAQYAADHPEAHLKSEAWYIVEAEPDAVIYKGIQQGVTPKDFRKAIETGSQEDVEALLIKVPVKKGQAHYLPSGTCHALGAGILVAEAQTPSDTTFRVYDWGRTDRQMHIEEAMQCIDFGPPDVAMYEKRSHIAGMFTTISSLISCEHFRIEKVRMIEGFEQELPYDQPAIWMVLQGKGQIITAGKNSATPDIEFQRGQTLFMPANMTDAKVKLETDTVWLEITFPQTMTEQFA